MRGLRTIICVCLILITLIISSFAVFSVENIVSESENPSGFIIKDFDGKLAIFANGAKTPFNVTDIDTQNLPKTDRENLQNGIFIADEGSLAMILEDFGS